MKKFISNLTIFSFYSFLIYILALFTWGNYAPKLLKANLKYPIGSSGHLYTRLKEVKKANNVDILFLGSSHAIRGFDTRAFKSEGYHTFNLGSKAGTPLQTSTLLKRYLDQLNPKLVVYEVYPVTFEIDGVEASLHLLSNDIIDRYSFELAFKQNHIKAYNTLFYGSIRELLNQNNSFKEDPIRHKDTYVPGGFVERDCYHWHPTQFEIREIKVNKAQLNTFETIIKLLKSKNINILLVFAPITPSLYSSFSNISYFDSLMNSYSKYYNFNEIMTLNDSLHFYDSNHQNKKGIDEFTPKLIEIINDE